MGRTDDLIPRAEDRKVVELMIVPPTVWIDAAHEIDDIPAVDAAPVVHGRWIENEGLPYCTCSVCGGDYWFGLYETLKYRPNCGAKMDGGEEG